MTVLYMGLNWKKKNPVIAQTCEDLFSCHVSPEQGNYALWMIHSCRVMNSRVDRHSAQEDEAWLWVQAKDRRAGASIFRHTKDSWTA